MISRSTDTDTLPLFSLKRRKRLKRPRVLINLSGGLGNQLFQVAAAKHLELQNVVVALDPIENDLNGYRKTQVTELSKGMDLNLIQRSSVSKFLIRIAGIRKIIYSGILRDSFEELQPFGIIELNQSDLPKRVMGYWQNKKMAMHVKNYLDNSKKINIRFNQLALHVRRGDYLMDAHNLHGALHGDYFLAAVESITEQKKLEKIVIFSDSINQVKEESWIDLLPNIKIEFNKETDPWVSLLEMSSFEMIVCSNSTFSWWAAFLNKNKTIILPDYWFRDFKIPAGLQIEKANYIKAKFID